MEATVRREVIPENTQPIVWATTIPFAVPCALSCAIRLYARAFIAKSFGMGDWFMLACAFVWVGQQYIAWMWTILGGGLHVSEVPQENVAKVNVYLFVEEFHYLFLQFLIKMSFFFFCRRTLCTTDAFRRTIYVVMTLVGLQILGTWIFYALQCIPIQAFFNPAQYPDVVCIQSDITFYAPSVANVSMEVVIYVMPVFPVLRMQATLRRRLGLIAIFTLGGEAVMVSLLRFIVLWQLGNTDDPTFVFGSVTIVTSIEFAAAIITANMPGMTAFYKHWSTGGFTSSTASSEQDKGFEMESLVIIGRARSAKPGGAVTLNSRVGSEEQLNPQEEIGKAQ